MSVQHGAAGIAPCAEDEETRLRQADAMDGFEVVRRTSAQVQVRGDSAANESIKSSAATEQDQFATLGGVVQCFEDHVSPCRERVGCVETPKERERERESDLSKSIARKDQGCQHVCVKPPSKANSRVSGT